MNDDVISKLELISLSLKGNWKIEYIKTKESFETKGYKYYLFNDQRIFIRIYYSPKNENASSAEIGFFDSKYKNFYSSCKINFNFHKSIKRIISDFNSRLVSKENIINSISSRDKKESEYKKDKEKTQNHELVLAALRRVIKGQLIESSNYRDYKIDHEVELKSERMKKIYNSDTRSVTKAYIYFNDNGTVHMDLRDLDIENVFKVINLLNF